MRWLWGGGQPDDALIWELRQQGHVVTEGPSWYSFLLDGKSPVEWGRQVVNQLREGYDVFVLIKGAYYRPDGRLWYPDARVLQEIRRAVPRMIYLCYDDPAFTPVQLGVQIAQWFDAYGTTCPGIVDLFRAWRHRMSPTVFEHWLAWDRRTTLVYSEPVVDVAFTGTPYYAPFPVPHYQGGFSCRRIELVEAALSVTQSVGLWGSEQWMDPTRGGAEACRPYYRGWLNPDRIHEAHAAARVCVATHLVEGYRYDSGRLPWQGGAGTCVLHEERPGLREEFGDMVEWFRPGDITDFTDKLRGLLGDKARAGEKARALQAYVYARHTWKNRADDLIAIAEKIQPR